MSTFNKFLDACCTNAISCKDRTHLSWWITLYLNVEHEWTDIDWRNFRVKFQNFTNTVSWRNWFLVACTGSYRRYETIWTDNCPLSLAAYILKNSFYYYDKNYFFKVKVKDHYYEAILFNYIRHFKSVKWLLRKFPDNPSWTSFFW